MLSHLRYSGLDSPKPPANFNYLALMEVNARTPTK